MKNILFFFLKHYRGFSLSVWLNLVAVLINSGVSVVALFLVLYLTNQLHFTATDAGWVITAFGLGGLIGSFSSGFLCDRFNSQIISFVALFTNACLLLILPFVSQFYFLSFLALLLGVSNFAFSPANRVTMMSLTNHQDHVRISSIRYMMMNLGIGAYVFIGGRLVAYGYIWLFILSGISVLCIACIMFLNYLKTLSHVKSNIPEPAHSDNSSGSGLLKQFVWLYLGLLGAALVFAQLRITYPLYLHNYYHLNERLFSNIFLVNTIIIALFQMPIINSVSKTNSYLTSGIGIFLMGIGMGFIFAGSSYYFAILLCLVWTTGEILYYSTLQVIIYSKAKAEHKGRHMGYYQTTVSAGNILGPTLGSWLYSFSGAIWLWFGCIAIGLGGLVLHIMMRDNQD